MSNKRVSQLVELTAAGLRPDDLFYIIDVNAKEGKKIRISEIGSYLNVSGSLIAIHSELSDTASYILGNNVHGDVAGAIFSLSALSASWSALSVSSSYALTASYSLNGNAGTSSAVSSSWAASSISASYALKSSISDLSAQTSFLIYTGANNGTAAYAITSQNVLSSSYAKTASYVDTTIVTVATASYSLQSGQSDASLLAFVSNELNYPNSSTASHAITAENFSYNHFIDYGVFSATSQSLFYSKLDLVNVSASSGNPTQTNIGVIGTVIVPYTSSISLDENIKLFIKNIDTGIETLIDSTPIYVNISRTINTWGDLQTGSIKMPYNLIGSSSMYGNYTVYATASSEKIQIEPTRYNKFDLSSFSNNLIISQYEPPLFTVSPVSLILIEFTASNAGPFFDTRDGMLTSGSQNIQVLNIRNTNASSIRYVWSLPNLTTLDCGQNNLLFKLTGMPNALLTMSCDSCSINTILPISNTSMSYFNCGQNNLSTLPTLSPSMSYLNCSSNILTTLPSLPNTMSFLDCSNNLITTIPSFIPYGITELKLKNNSLAALSSTLPESLITMSIGSNPMYLISSVLPNSMSWMDTSYTSISSFPLLPTSLLYLNTVSCSLNQSALDGICSQSLSNGLNSGSLLLNGNGTLLVTTINNYVYPLQTTYGWTVEYDV